MALRGRVVTIVGGYGRMGRLFARIFKRDGFDVVICGSRLSLARKVARRLGVRSQDVDSAVREADTVLASVPIESTYAVCKQVSTVMHSGALLLDIASVKTGIADRLFRELPAEVDYASIHPLFGPNVKALKGRNLIVIEGSRSEQEVVRYFKQKGCNVTVMSVQEHDRAMALLQAAHHFALLSYVRLLEERLGDRGLHNLLTESVKATLRTARWLARSEVVQSIRRQNPYADEAIRSYLHLLSQQRS